MWERIKHIIIKEFIQMLRDPKMRVVMFVSPLFQVVLMSFAVTTDVKKIPTAVYDQDRSKESRQLIRDFEGSRYFRVRANIDDDREQKKLIDMSMVKAVIRIPHGFSGDVLSGRTASVQLIVDGTDSNTAAIILQYASRIAERYSRRTRQTPPRPRLSVSAGAGGVDLRSRAWFNENLDSRNFFVPGVIALVVLVVTLILSAMTIVKEKELGTIEQLMVSPLRPMELIVGKLIPYGVVGMVDIVLITLLSVLAFHVPLRGNLFLFFISSCLFLLTTLGLGLFISTCSNTQQEALMSMFFVAQPMVLLSGFVFPIANMPGPVRLLTAVNPLKYFLIIIRGVFLKGSGIDILWPQMAALLAIGASIVLLSAALFRRRVG